MSGDQRQTPVVPTESIVYGEVVYWITILAAIICMVGPLVAVVNPKNNLLDPHLVFANIFGEEEPCGVWALSANEEPHLPVRVTNVPEPLDSDALGVHTAVKILEELPVPEAGAPVPTMEIDGKLRLARLPVSGEDSWDFTLTRFEDGADDGGAPVTAHKARVEMLDLYKNVVVKDGHFWMSNPTAGDSLTQLGLALGCSVALWGLLLAAGLYLRKKIILYALLGLWVAALVFVSAAGFVNLH